MPSVLPLNSSPVGVNSFFSCIAIRNDSSFDTMVTLSAQSCLEYFLSNSQSAAAPSLAYHYLTLMALCPWSRLDISLFDMVMKLLPHAWKIYQTERTMLREGSAETVRAVLGFASFT